MKTRNKIVALVEIAVVLCSMFLVALPAIAAEQETQKVTASEVTAASEDDFILEIYGNANEDDCIDMRDYTYTARIICWLEEETTFADANYDGRISVADMTQAGLIILGRESELTLVDSDDRIVTVQKPVERIVTFSLASTETAKILKAEDRVVGVDQVVRDRTVFFPELSKLPAVGAYGGCGGDVDYEKMLELNPDIVIAYPEDVCGVTELVEMLEPAGITVIRLNLLNPIEAVEETKKLGYILDKKDEANEYIDFYEECLKLVEEKAEQLSEEDKPRVYFEMFWDYYTFTGDYVHDILISIAGGRNIAADIGDPEQYIEIDKEWVVEQNPEIIVRAEYYVAQGYEVDDPSEMAAARETILARPELAKVTAIKNGDVYMISYAELIAPCRHFVGIAYMAKWFHPELFEDLDPNAMHQEYLTRFMRLDYDLDEHGVFVYHSEEHPDGR